MCVKLSVSLLMAAKWKNFRPLSELVYVPEREVTALSSTVLKELRNQASQTSEKKSRILLHGNAHNDLHEMVITHSKGTYIRPHLNESSAKSFLVFDGEMVVCYFDKHGTVIDRFLLQELGNEGDFFLRFEQPIFHTIVVVSETVTFLETVRGPHRKTQYAGFAPMPGDERADQYFAQLESDSRDWIHSQDEHGAAE